LLQLGDLLAMEQELAGTDRVEVPAVALLVGRDVHLAHPDFAVIDRGPRLREAGLADAQALDLGAGEHEPGFDRVQDGVVVARAPVLGDEAILAATWG